MVTATQYHFLVFIIDKSVVEKLVLAFSYPADNINCVLSIRTSNKFHATGEFHNPKYDSTTFPKSTISYQVYLKCY